MWPKTIRFGSGTIFQEGFWVLEPILNTGAVSFRVDLAGFQDNYRGYITDPRPFISTDRIARGPNFQLSHN